MDAGASAEIEVTAAPTAAMLGAIRTLCDAAFGSDFGDADWAHTLGGTHAIATIGGEVVSHAAVVPRSMVVGGRHVAVGYVEGVATAPRRQGDGLGSMVMRAINDIIRSEFELGALSTSATGFYERLDWERWRGATHVQTPTRLVRTVGEDDGIMVFRVPALMVDLAATLVCTERDGDDW